MTKEDFLAAYNIGHRDGKEDVYCPNDYDDIFNIEQQSCENCCNGNQEEKAKLCQKSYIAGMEHNCEDEQIIRIKKGTLKARTGKYVVYDVEWLKTHFNTTEAKIYGQPSERTETHECDYISRQAAIDALWKALHEYEDKTENQFSESKELDVADWFQYRIFVQNMSDIDRQTILNLPSATPQPKAEHKQKTGHWVSHSEYCKMNNLIPSGLGCYFWCSECNCGIDYKYFHLANYKYCPECGAKMQEEEQ